MPGKCGNTYRIAPKLSADPCNVLEQRPSGLLVARTTLAGVAPGSAVGTARSVDVDVQAPDPDACPAVWTIGARLTPVGGEVIPSAALNLLPLAAGVWGNIPGMSFVAPEAGIYLITADVSGGMTAGAQSSFNRLTQTRMTLNGTPINGSLRQLQQLDFFLTAGQTMSAGENASNSATKRVTLAAGDVVAVQAEYQSTTGTAASLSAGNPLGSLLTWQKVSD
ncbi:hypothetical protein [Streptomyces sp. NPDC001068]|uniref:hypothetical protein n=1 Tax=Streptomyces sp. NPDC001068 TaxID=3364544 RepID=UPI0036BC6203